MRSVRRLRILLTLSRPAFIFTKKDGHSIFWNKSGISEEFAFVPTFVFALCINRLATSWGTEPSTVRGPSRMFSRSRLMTKMNALKLHIPERAPVTTRGYDMTSRTLSKISRNWNGLYTTLSKIRWECLHQLRRRSLFLCMICKGSATTTKWFKLNVTTRRLQTFHMIFGMYVKRQCVFKDHTQCLQCMKPNSRTEGVVVMQLVPVVVELVGAQTPCLCLGRRQSVQCLDGKLNAILLRWSKRRLWMSNGTVGY